MPQWHRFDFSPLRIPTVASTQLAEVARQAEGNGFSTLVFPDHLLDQLSPIPAMAAVVAVTERLRVAAFVLNNDLHHPAVLGQDLASIDVLSGGRLDVAIGAGWNKPEYDAIGLSFDGAATRVSRLAEAVAVLKGIFGDGAFSFRGEHYTFTDYDGKPDVVQRPHPPFFIGGGGRRTVELAGREANIVGLAPRILSGQRADPMSMTWEATVEKIEWAKAAAGDRARHLEFNVYPSGWPVVVTDDLGAEVRKVIDYQRKRTGVELTEDDVVNSPHFFIGSVERLVEKFTELRDRLGITSFMTGGPEELVPVVERLAGT